MSFYRSVFGFTIVLSVLALCSSPAFADSAERPDHIRCGTCDLRLTLGDDLWTTVGPVSDDGLGTLPCDHTPVGPPPNPQIGDSWDWYIWRLNGFPQADLKSCTIRGMGPNCYVVVEDTQWNVNINQAQVDIIVDHFENISIGPFPTDGIWDINTFHFGDPPDNLDQDPRVYILYYDFDVGSDGYFWAFDQQCDDVAAFNSNETDVVYMNCSDFDPAGSYLLAVLGHEFEHLIHYNYDPNKLSWVDEGLAELAMWLYGNPDLISGFNSNPDRRLTLFDGVWADYIKSYLWTLYFYERYGGQPSIKALVEEPLNSIAGYEQILDDFAYTEDFQDVFADWVVANFLDDTSIGDGRFGYQGDTLPPFFPFATYSTYPVGPFNGFVNHWAADYVRYLDGTSLEMSFDGSDNNEFAVRAMLLDQTSPTEVVDMTLDAFQAGTLLLPQVGDTHAEAVMVYADISDGGNGLYSYGAEQDPSSVPGGPTSLALSLTALTSASSEPGFALAIPPEFEGRDLRLEIVDSSGRRVDRVSEGTAVAGRHEVRWSQDASLPSGAYFAVLTVGDERRVARVTLIQ